MPVLHVIIFMDLDNGLLEFAYSNVIQNHIFVWHGCFLLLVPLA